MITATVLGAAALIATISDPGNGPAAAQEQPAPAATGGIAFRIASANAGIVDSGALKGRPYGVFFGFTHCPEICPITLFGMSKALKALGPGIKDFRLFFVTVDPERDIAAILREYMANFDPRIEALVPSPAELARLAHALNATYRKEPMPDGGYAMSHPVEVYLVNREGKLVNNTFFGDYPKQRLALLRSLIEE